MDKITIAKDLLSISAVFFRPDEPWDPMPEDDE